jgi:hypothetical protein
MANMKDWALWYVQAHDLAVFPLPPNRKQPGALGITSATRDLAQIAAWWDAEPAANIAVTGCLRIDIDPKKNGIENWNALIAQYGDPYTLRVRTPSGGQHYYFRAPATITNSPGALPKGIDVRGATAGYTVAPPSYTTLIPAKQQEGFYELVDASVPIAPCPKWLLDILTALDRVEEEKSGPLRHDITQDQLNDLRSALMSPEMLTDWEKWSDIGYALLGLGETGRQLFFEYSAAQREAMPDRAIYETEEIWWRNHRNSTPRSDYRSVFSRAQTLGWKNPKSIDASKLGFGQAPLPTGAVAAPSPGRKFEVKNGWEFANAPGIRWRIDKILPQQGVAIIYGPPAVGKSFLMIDLLMAITRGIPYGDDQFRTEQAPALYVLAEGAAGVKQRLRAYQQFNQLGPQTPSVHVIAEAPNLFDANDSQALIDAAVPTGAKVVAIDTLHSSMMGGDENSAKDMGIVLGHCRKLAAAIEGLVILVHHVGKDATRGVRGSSSISGAVETEIQLTVEDDGLRVADIRKQKDGDNSISWQFRLMPRQVAGPGGMEESAVVTHVPTQAIVEKKVVEKTVTIDDAVLGLLASQGGMSTEEGMSLEIVIANVLEMRPDLSHAKVNSVITKAINQGIVQYINGDFLRYPLRENTPPDPT